LPGDSRAFWLVIAAVIGAPLWCGVSLFGGFVGLVLLVAWNATILNNVWLPLGGIAALIFFSGFGVGVALALRKPAPAQVMARAAKAEEYRLAARKTYLYQMRPWLDWERACARWEMAYYCHRDDVVFVPSDSRPKAWPVAQLNACLYAEESH
jgi:hypothetical protein